MICYQENYFFSPSTQSEAYQHNAILIWENQQRNDTKNVEERREVSALCVTSWDQFEMSHDDFADLQDFFF